MKHEVTTLNTKKMMAASLKKLMEKKPFSKITVSEIIADCGVNRKTFYYHFSDIYALLQWMLEEEAIKVVAGFDLMKDFEEAMDFTIGYVEENQHILNCAYDSIGREGMKRFLYLDFHQVCYDLVKDVEDSLGLRVDEEFESMLCDFYTEAVAGMIINWFSGGKAGSRKETIENISLIFKASLPEILKARALKLPGSRLTFN
ncbi:MAG: TetR/AcrR family transcriptional regulator C-terminal domain-containing protein [Emergencia sp.]